MAGTHQTRFLGDRLSPRARARLNSVPDRPISSAMSFAARFDDVLAAAQHGSEWAWQQILGELGPGIQAYARSQGVQDPEDLLGQVLEGIVRGIDRFRGNEATFRSWAFTIAHSRIIDSRRKVDRRPKVADRDVPDVAGEHADAHDASTSLSREAAMALLETLPAKQREVVALRVVAGLSVEETARVLRKRPGAVRVAMHRAMQTLEKENLPGGVTQ
jgi:RNA polymerase sigma-70 factor (ECF subfamily)